MAPRRRPAADSLAQLRPAGQTGRPSIRSGRKAATRRSCSTCGSRRADRRGPRDRRVGRQFRRHGVGRLMPQRGVQRLLGRRAAHRNRGRPRTGRFGAGPTCPVGRRGGGGKRDRHHCRNGPPTGTDAKRWSWDEWRCVLRRSSMGGPASSATLQGLMEQLAVAEAPDRRHPAGNAGPGPAAHRHRDGNRARRHPPDRSDRCVCGSTPCVQSTMPGSLDASSPEFMRIYSK